jgi:hypothetical protein
VEAQVLEIQELGLKRGDIYVAADTKQAPHRAFSGKVASGLPQENALLL